MFKLAFFLATVATIQAQLITPAITTQNQNIYRTLGNLGQVSAYSKTIDTPYSSVSKSDVRVSNPGITTVGGLGYAHGVAPIGLAHGPLLAQRLHAPAVAVARPLGVAPAGLLGVAYSAAPVVSHMSYTNGLGLSYAW